MPTLSDLQRRGKAGPAHSGKTVKRDGPTRPWQHSVKIEEEKNQDEVDSSKSPIDLRKKAEDEIKHSNASDLADTTLIDEIDLKVRGREPVIDLGSSEKDAPQVKSKTKVDLDFDLSYRNTSNISNKSKAKLDLHINDEADRLIRLYAYIKKGDLAFRYLILKAQSQETNGLISISQKNSQSLLNFSNSTSKRFFKELEEMKLIKLEKEASSSDKSSRVYRVLEFV